MDTATTIDACARTAYVLAWAAAEEECGRTYSGCDLLDVAPDGTPDPFTAWADDAVSQAVSQAAPDTLTAWSSADPEDLGRALALSVGGWTAGLDEQDLPGERNLPTMDCDTRLWVDAEE